MRMADDDGGRNEPLTTSEESTSWTSSTVTGIARLSERRNEKAACTSRTRASYVVRMADVFTTNHIRVTRQFRTRRQGIPTQYPTPTPMPMLFKPAGCTARPLLSECGDEVQTSRHARRVTVSVRSLAGNTLQIGPIGHVMTGHMQ